MAVAVKRVSAVVRVPWGGNILEAVEDGFKSGLADAQAKLGALSTKDRELVERWHDSIVWSRLREIFVGADEDGAGLLVDAGADADEDACSLVAGLPSRWEDLSGDQGNIHVMHGRGNRWGLCSDREGRGVRLGDAPTALLAYVCRVSSTAVFYQVKSFHSSVM
jgi:hypothetical protein